MLTAGKMAGRILALIAVSKTHSLKNLFSNSLLCASLFPVCTLQNQDSEKHSTVAGACNGEINRKKIKGKRAVVRWLKFFRWKKKNEYQRMTAEEKNTIQIEKVINKNSQLLEDDMDTELDSDPEDFSDTFAIDLGTEKEVKEVARPLYLDKFEKFADQNDKEIDDFEEHLR